jgi:hypothetical protein
MRVGFVHRQGSAQVVAWLDKIVKPVLASSRKVGISMAEQQVCVQTECCLRSMQS